MAESANRDYLRWQRTETLRSEAAQSTEMRSGSTHLLDSLRKREINPDPRSETRWPGAFSESHAYLLTIRRRRAHQARIALRTGEQGTKPDDALLATAHA